MNEVDENGWAHVHHAAFRGYLKSLEKFVKTNEEQLELETEDELHSTPLLLAVMSGSLETVKFVVELGACVGVINSQNHGVVELCAFKQFIELLQYFIDLDHSKIPVWKRLVKFQASQLDVEAEAAAKCLCVLTQKSNNDLHEQWKAAYENGVVPGIAKVIKSGPSDEAKIETFWLLLNMIQRDEVKDQYLSSGGLAGTVKHLKSTNNLLTMLAARSIKEFCSVKQYTDPAVIAGVIPALTKLLQSNHDPEVLVEAVDALGNIASGKESHQSAIGQTQWALSSIVGLFENCTNRSLLMALTRAIAKISYHHENNQNSLINEGVSHAVITLTGVKNKDLQLNTVLAIHCLAEGNENTQKQIIESGAVMPLMNLVKKGRQPNLQEKTAEALWALAGENAEERRSMGGLLGVGLLIEFLTSLNENLHYIGSEGLGVLAQGPLSKQTAIAHANGVHPLVRLLHADKEHIVLSVIRTIRHLCIGVAFVPHTQNQNTISHARGIKFLVAMMSHSKNEMIQVEAAHSLGCLCIGNVENLEELLKNPDFSYLRIIKMMYSKIEMVRLLAGSALASFAYNSVSNQKEISTQGGVRFSCFVPFLQSEDEFLRCNAAFQVVILARIIPDEEQAISSAAGVKLLADILTDSKSDTILALAADCIARLAHTRAGVPGAIVSIDTVDVLCTLLLSQGQQVRGCAAIALGYLSYNHTAERKLLNKCRLDPYLMKLVVHFNKSGKLSERFMQEWKHYQKVGLPPIDELREQYTGKKSVHYKDPGGRQLTIVSMDDTVTSTQIASSLTNLGVTTEEDKNTRRSSMSSRGTNPSSAHSTMPPQKNGRQPSIEEDNVPELMKQEVM